MNEVLTPGEVAIIFRVSGKTVLRWANAGRLPCFRTLGGHRRYHASEVELLLREIRQEDDARKKAA